MSTPAAAGQPQSKLGAAVRFLISGVSKKDPLARRAFLTAAMVAGGVLVVVSGAIHLRLWQMSYRNIPTIGPSFIIQGIVGVLVGLAIIGFRRLDKAVIGAGYMLASLIGLLLSIEVGLFGFHETLAAPYAGTSLFVEGIGLVILTAVAVVVARSGLSERAMAKTAALATRQGAPGTLVVAPHTESTAPSVGSDGATPVTPWIPAAPVAAPVPRRSGSSSWKANLSRPNAASSFGPPAVAAVGPETPRAAAAPSAWGTGRPRGGSSSWR